MCKYVYVSEVQTQADSSIQTKLSLWHNYPRLKFNNNPLGEKE